MGKRKIEFSMDDCSERVTHDWLLEAFMAGGAYDYYTPPIPYHELSKALRANSAHESALRAKRNILMTTLKPTKLINAETFSKFSFEFLWLGNAYLEVIRSQLKNPIKLKYIPAKHVRVGKITKTNPKPRYYFMNSNGQAEKIKGEVIHLKEHDVNQTIYGVPEYLSALPSVFLSEAATLFRRRYYENGSHAGFILHITADIGEEASKEIEEKMQQMRGKDNFKNLFLYDPGGTDGAVTLTPISEIKAKDEFATIKDSCRADILTMHRVPLELMSIIPENTSGLGDVEKSAKVFAKNELGPIQLKMQTINDQLGVKALDFDQYTLED